MIYLVQSVGYIKLYYTEDKFSLELDLLEFNPDFTIIAQTEGSREDVIKFNNEHLIVIVLSSSNA